MRTLSVGSVGWTLVRLSVLAGLGILLSLAIQPPAWTSAAPGEQADDDLVLRELAARLLAPPPSVEQLQIHAVDLFPSALPPDMPVSLPIPPGGRLVGSARFTRTGGRSASVILDSPLDPSATLEFYREQLASQGWSAPPVASSPPGVGGIRPSEAAVGAHFCSGPTGPWLLFSAVPREDGATDVRVYAEDRAIGPGPCSPPVAPPTPSMPSQRLPSLPAPPGLVVRVTGLQGGPDRVTTEAVVETDMSSAELEAHYAGLLQAAGWIRRAGDAQPALAWSTWDVPGEGAWGGFLYARETSGQNRRSVYVQMETASPLPGAGIGPPPLGPFVPAAPPPGR